MMTSKMNRHNAILFALILLFLSNPARALDAFECVRDIMPISEQSGFQSPRKGVERPFMLSDNYMAYPEVNRGTVTGFYVYTSGKAWYYDAVEIKEQRANKRKMIAELKPGVDHYIYNLVAQPTGLETITVQYLPGFKGQETTAEGPVILGSSVLPVMGALVSRDNESLHMVYRNPAEAGEVELKRWIIANSRRKPPATDMKDMPLSRKIWNLRSVNTKTPDELWAPLLNEVKLRKEWVQTHNLDLIAFKKMSILMEGSCK
jgi:hypothetical protein